jgi:hypothetical protein
MSWELAVETSWVAAAFQTKAPVKKIDGIEKPGLLT